MINTTIVSDWDDLSKQLLLPVLYFDIFSYPLLYDEIIKFCGYANLSKETALTKLNNLVENKILFRINEFYSIDNNSSKVASRLKNNERAKLVMPKALDMSGLISRFPFVQAVFISGSLSKNVMTEDADIDYFIITKKDRLWICRTLLIIYKKIFLFNSHKYFCLNYFIDESHLLIEEQNRYTATEIVTLKPMVGGELYQAFMKENKWVSDFYPQYQLRSIEGILKIKPNLLQSFAGFVFSKSIGTYFNAFLMKWTLAYWKQKFSSFDEFQFLHAFKSTPYVSKHHPNNFQDRVLNAFNVQVRNFEITHEVKFDDSIS